MSNVKNPEIGRTIDVNGIKTNLHDIGSGPSVMLIHGSGPGVTAWANWRLVMPELSKNYRVVAPDMLGFGFTERPTNTQCNVDRWINHAIGILDALDIEQCDLVGNSFGGGIALALAIRHPHRVRRLILMGSVGVPFTLTPGLDAVWGYSPSLTAMKSLLDIFAYDRSLVTDELAELRYEASIRPGFHEAFSSMFPAPRQRWIDALASEEADIRAIQHQTLIMHGREDQIIPLQTSQKLFEWIPKSQLHVFGQCGHWTQIEHAARFSTLVSNFLAEI
ncbi:alpha/beta fold hydrolase [Alteromonas macleodii]|jgi:2-hydroxymuconate-semialdehyde hydrolase|uniref:alpha/beta fold hydrolase n=1 Tax=Alteromonas macleodii TaxID=28108 RepID=UPI00066B8526|nr:alpha/beta hydrolase [Alteromonas macleodii]CAI3957600.1 2-hydroxymuconate semialdehyde hydrolase [Alteromonas macleodii]VTP52800.1 2-hydroxymuconate semialdehyde hydrolase [Alteromonas macleodii]|tara:strand:+ start:1159 stop:1989 length:831 start_codon:yes stop_codon:yes gene_type:complete